MLASIPLTDDERAAVEDGQEALSNLLGRLADSPTPAGPPTAIQLPIVSITNGHEAFKIVNSTECT